MAVKVTSSNWGKSVALTPFALRTHPMDNLPAREITTIWGCFSVASQTIRRALIMVGRWREIASIVLPLTPWKITTQNRPGLCAAFSPAMEMQGTTPRPAMFNAQKKRVTIHRNNNNSYNNGETPWGVNSELFPFWFSFWGASSFKLSDQAKLNYNSMIFPMNPFTRHSSALSICQLGFYS